MSPKFNIDRPKISDEELKKHQDFDKLVNQFKEQSLKKARGDESWWKNKRIRYSTVIAGVTVVCTITYLSLFKNKTQQKQTHETVITQKTQSTSTPSSKPFIAAPSQKLKINYSAYTVNNGKGGDITHHTASKIKVPKNAFVDKNGKDIVGDVTIEYKEFHDMGDVIAGGIPMAYDSAGTKYNLETAGMFDIRGSQNGEPVFIKPNKQVQVELASQNNEDRFNQYYLDTIKKNWIYIRRDKATPMASKHLTEHTLHETNSEALISKNPKLADLKKQVEVILPKKIDSVKVVYTTKAERLARPKEPVKPAKASGRPIFQLDSDTKEFPELAAFKNAVFEVGDENRNYSKELHDITWSDVKISQGPNKGKNYLLVLSYRSRSEKLIVYPVLQGADYAKAKEDYDQKLDTYNGLLEKKQAEEKRLLAEMEAKQAAYIAEQKKKQKEYDEERAKLMAKYKIEESNELANGYKNLNNQARATRLFNVSSFGIYNSDCPHSMPAGKQVEPTFVSEQHKNMIPGFIYLVDHTAKTVYSIGKEDGFKLTYNPANDYSICIFDKNKLFLCTKEAFKDAVSKQSNTFVIMPLPDAADNLVDFKKALEI